MDKLLLKLNYIPEIDGLRTIAILLVILEHWLPPDHPINMYSHNGALGVNLFFVLSGFLIGRILIVEKIKMEITPNLKIWSLLKIFYIRRSLRIFPIYYIFITIILISKYPFDITQNFIWLASYTTNIGLVFQNLQLGHLTHLWSLAVEEQFYLILPCLIFIFPKKRMIPMLGFFILAGIFSRVFFYWAGFTKFSWFTVSVFDFFGFGVLLAYAEIHKIKLPFPRAIPVISLILYIYLSSTFFHFKGRSLIGIILPTLPVFYIYIIHYVYKGNRIVNKILGNKPIVFLGKISYSIYLFHYIVPDITSKILHSNNILHFSFIINCIIVVLMSSLSFIFIEKPINRLKLKINY
jgi:peptidoglycan/LPS O-acetylase OafA/YrhL